MKYFPFLRGKQNEMIALRDLAEGIVANGNVIPILEVVNANQTTLISIDRFIQTSMPFLFICNPVHGDFSNDADGLITNVISRGLADYDNWIPALYVNEVTTPQEVDSFTAQYEEQGRALIYRGRPQSAVRSRIEASGVSWHVFLVNRVETGYIESIPIDNRVLIVDSFRRRSRNVDYPDEEFFTDLNTVAGNSRGVAFGDFSIVGDYYTETGGPANAVALHHIHFTEDSNSLSIHHFKSDRVETPVDTSGKIIEAVDNVVAALDSLQPNDTEACNEYRAMSTSQISHGLGYLKRLAVKHHLEVILRDDGLEQH